MDLARATEAAALAAGRWLGRGDKNGADGAAVDAMRLVLNTVPMEGVVVIGEGEKDEAPMLFNGEEIGSGVPACDIAVDPIDGTTLTSEGGPGAISVIAASPRGTMFDPGPIVYMDKVAMGHKAAKGYDPEAPMSEQFKAVAAELGKEVSELMVAVLKRDRHNDLIASIRATGARVRLFGDGDVAMAIATALPGTGVDMLMGVGGTPEGVIAAAALKCLGGSIYGKLYPRNPEELQAGIDFGFDMDAVISIDDLVDSGATARLVREMIPRAHYATLYAKPMGRPLVDTYVTEVSQDTWIYFPWDVELQFAHPIASRRRGD